MTVAKGKKLDCEDNGEDIVREYKRKEKPASTTTLTVSTTPIPSRLVTLATFFVFLAACSFK